MAKYKTVYTAESFARILRKETMESVPGVNALKALGDSTRFRAVMALQKQSLCVCQIVELLELSPSTISKHLQILSTAGIVQSEKRGRWVYYSLSDSGAKGIPSAALKLILVTAQNSEQAKVDNVRLKEILLMEPEILCEKQRKC